MYNVAASQIANRQRRGRPRRKSPKNSKPSPSKSQTKLAKYCKAVLLNRPTYTQEWTRAWLKTSAGANMFVDIIFPSLKLAIEFNGPQHYLRTKYTATTSKLQALQDRDKLKVKLLKEHDFTVLVWPYTKCISLKRVYEELHKLGFDVSMPPRKKPGPKSKPKRKRVRAVKRVKRRT